MVGLPVLAISYDGSDQFIPRMVCRLDTDYGWAWNNVGNDFPVYADNQAYFNYWLPITSLPSPPITEKDNG